MGRMDKKGLNGEVYKGRRKRQREEREEGR
jgi:hypothetical protein